MHMLAFNFGGKFCTAFFTTYYFFTFTSLIHYCVVHVIAFSPLRTLKADKSTQSAAGEPCFATPGLTPKLEREYPQFLQYVRYQGFSNPHLAQFDFTLLPTFFEKTLFFPLKVRTFRRFFFSFFPSFASNPNRANIAL